MLCVAKLALLLAATGLSQPAAERPRSDRADVLRLTDEDYASSVADAPLLLVKFCARWSRPCKLLATEYRAAAQLLAGSGHTGIMAELDASEEMRSAQLARIVSYPTIKLFRRGQVVDTFTGEFTASAMAAYVQQ
jgi:thioredoxin-like negative regulator of GroEL